MTPRQSQSKYTHKMYVNLKIRFFLKNISQGLITRNTMGFTNLLAWNVKAHSKVNIKHN